MAGSDYYDRGELWGPKSGYGEAREEARAQALVEAVPSDTRTILDVGCGDGTVTNVLARHFEVTGADIAPSALALVEAPTVQASADSLPFDDREFDAVLLAEVLEHLEDEEYERAREEAARVARDTIVITVPNQENLFSSAVRCPRCGERFSPWRHTRRFAPRDLSRLFPGFEATKVQAIGPLTERRTTLEGAVRRVLARGAPLPFPALCPSCGLTGEAPRQGPRLAPVRRTGLQRLVRRRLPQWLLAVFRRH